MYFAHTNGGSPPMPTLQGKFLYLERLPQLQQEVVTRALPFQRTNVSIKASSFGTRNFRFGSTGINGPELPFN